MAAPQQTSDLLYHIKRTIIDYHEDKSGATRITDILSTFTDLAAAKAAANSALASEGYLRDDFELYEQKNEVGVNNWKHGDGVEVFAKAPAGQEFEVRLDTKPNVLNLKGNADGEVEGSLHYGKHSLFCSEEESKLTIFSAQFSRPQSTTTPIASAASKTPKSKAHSSRARMHSKLRIPFSSTTR
jgi:hypothetical protein